MRHTFFKLMVASIALGCSVNLLAAAHQDNPMSYDNNPSMDQLNAPGGENNEENSMQAMPDSNAQQPMKKQTQSLHQPEQPEQHPMDEEMD